MAVQRKGKPTKRDQAKPAPRRYPSNNTAPLKTVEEPNEEKPSVPMNQNPQNPVQTKARSEVVKWIERTLNTGVCGLREEYSKLRLYTMPNMKVEAFKNNHEAGRNRYQDVPCQDNNRVVLKWPGMPIDYIHANYVATPQNPKRFICTQAPLESTTAEFWAMVLQEETTIIVMLCNVVEGGKNKCTQYWPQNASETFKVQSLSIEVNFVDSFVMPNTDNSIKKTRLNVQYKDRKGEMTTRLVTHFHWTDWPDRGVPPPKLTAMELLSGIRGSKQPIIVHCSAGIGRTGSIVAIEYIMQRLSAGEECAAMDELLKKLRYQRAYSIQTDVQYLYVHRIMLAYFLDKHRETYKFILETSDMKQKYENFAKEYEKATT